MSRAFKVGDVAVATAEWARGEVSAAAAQKVTLGWERLGDGAFVRHVLSARPLVVIDYEDDEAVERLDALLHRMIVQRSGSTHTIGDLAAALREFADPKPPRCTASLTVFDEDQSVGHECRESAGHDGPHVAAGASWTEAAS